MVMRGNCTFYEKVRLAQINGAKGLLIVSKDRLVTLLTTRVPVYKDGDSHLIMVVLFIILLR